MAERIIVMKISNLQLLLTNKSNKNQKIKALILLIFKRIAQRLIQGLIGSNEIRIWQTYDRCGNNWWHAYDPVTGRYACKESEAEMRIWIEQRFYYKYSSLASSHIVTKLHLVLM